ncbi:hypothetical protein QBC46DRAFT_273159, partial [Diplogelasinospora grovesii]
GWQLVRQENGERDVVAVYSPVQRGFKFGMFQFLGRGASGLFGDRWAIGAVLSALALAGWEQNVNLVSRRLRIR